MPSHTPYFRRFRCATRTVIVPFCLGLCVSAALRSYVDPDTTLVTIPILATLWTALRYAFGQSEPWTQRRIVTLLNESLVSGLTTLGAWTVGGSSILSSAVLLEVAATWIVAGVVLGEVQRRWPKPDDARSESPRSKRAVVHAKLRAKRALDLCVASLLAVPFLVLTVIVACVVVLVDRHGPFFVQVRHTRLRRPFPLIKLRTMRASGPPGTRPRWTAIADPRITAIGRFVRASHLDELPQILNVFAGHISWVGPRPERPEYAQVFEAALPMYHRRYHVPGGITGFAQVEGFAGNTSIRGRLEKDLHYCLEFDNVRDLGFIVLTLYRSIRPKHQEQLNYSPDDDTHVP